MKKYGSNLSSQNIFSSLVLDNTKLIRYSIFEQKRNTFHIVLAAMLKNYTCCGNETDGVDIPYENCSAGVWSTC